MPILSKYYKQEAYEQAVALRKRGFTYTEIAKICGVSRGTLSKWLAGEAFSKTVTILNKQRANKANSSRIKLINKARQAERLKHYKNILRQAETEFKHYRHSPLFISGLMLYYTVGDLGASTPIRFANARPELHRLMIIFSQEYLGIAKADIHFWLTLHKEHDPVVCLKYWSKQIKLSIGQFYKQQIVPKRTTRKNPLQFGYGNTIIGNTLLKKKLLHWVKLLEAETKN